MAPTLYSTPRASGRASRPRLTARGRVPASRARTPFQIFHEAQNTPHGAVASERSQLRKEAIESGGHGSVPQERAEAVCQAQLCRANGARRIVEAGTSYGVSTIYLAAAGRDNVHAAGGTGVVIGTEYEPTKASAARAHFEEAG